MATQTVSVDSVVATMWAVQKAPEQKIMIAGNLSTPGPYLALGMAPTAKQTSTRAVFVMSTPKPYDIDNLPAPGIEYEPGSEGEVIKARLSYYWPPWGDERGGEYSINCDRLPSGVLECKHLSTGELVSDWIGKAVACPAKYEIGTVFKIGQRFYNCRDRGGAIVENADGSIWLDVLYPWLPDGYAWGDVVDVKYWAP